ncbi:hypothetical protein [Bacillus toyonensis]|uniref:hypothetical protein n=1 Tax=Bacillus toyonensis TaxID=155322 RepID=UPI001CB91EEE|nr:hypothetical protein [Bacillus toyonensis]
MVRVLTQPEPGWQRIDDSDRNIIFEGENWLSGYSKYSDNYLKTFHYKESSHPSNSVQIKFSFVGTKLRIIGLANNGGYDSYATIIIDGNPERLDYYAWEGKRQAVIYEKINLNKGPHTVTIRGIYLNLDAIDIDSDGYVFTPKKVGEILDKPDPGWNRFDDADSLIKYGDGAWNRVSDDRYYNSTAVYSLTKSVVEFSFKGTGVRLVSKSVNLGYGPVDITIDGAKESYNPVLGSDNWKVLLYNKEGLKNEFHSVKLEGPEGIIMDAIDVLDGELVKTAKVGDVLLQPETGWKRIDDTDVNIKYSGNWTLIDNLPDYHNSTARFKHAKQSSVDNSAMSVTFKFKGTKLRVIGVSNNTYDREAQIIIDGKPETISFYANRDVSPTRVLLFDKQGLTDEIHTVELNGVFMHLDAIDIDENGSMVPPAKVGDVLLQPESRWTRFDDRHSLIKYGSGTWELATDSRYYDSTNTFSRVSCDIEFSFKGTGLRIVSKMITTTSGYGPVDVLIDGVTEKYSITGSSDQWQTLLYEKQGLPDAVHSVKLVAPNGIIMDAIDVLGGELVKPPAKVGDVLIEPESGWKRIDDTDSLINYSGPWTATTSDAGSYKKTVHFSGDSNPGFLSASFAFYGTSLRVIGLCTSYYQKGTITIDGITEDINWNGPEVKRCVTVYEKLNLVEGKHIVTIQGEKINLDAIDINEGGRFEKLVGVGDGLPEPEPGWKRIDDADSSIQYLGIWKTETVSKNYNQTLHYKHASSNTPPDANPVSIKFNFKGTKIRLIGILVSLYDSNAKILIDGVEETINFSRPSGEPAIYQALTYEKLGLSNELHTVEIKGVFINLDAIDIDSDGSIEKPPAKVGDQLLQPEPGWKRMDDADSNIQYDANWSKNVAYNSAYGGKSTCAKKGKNASMVFRFKGTKLRFIVGCAINQYYSDRIRVKIDDLPEEYFDAIAPQDTNQVLKYEKLGLDDVEHDVTVTVITTQPGALEYDFRMDAIDIDDTGTLVSRPGVGTVLTEPEKGWKRIDDTDPLIRYIGNWKLATGNDKHYNKTTHYNLDKKLDTSFEFEFVGTKLRLLAYGDSGYDTTSKVLIDGKEETMVYNSPSGNQVIRYEKIGLDRGKHTVKVIGKAMSLDSIDIDADGYLLARLGDKLVEPEPGWVRFDDTHKNIEYNGFWKTTEADVSCYNNTHHWKSKADNNDSTISARFLFKGTKFRLISMTSPSYPEDIELKIDGQKEVLKLSGESMQYQTFAYEKKNLEDMIHVIELSGKYISIDAIDLEEGATLLKLPDEKLKPYQIRSGLIFKDDFDTFDSRWIASPVGSYSLIDRKGNFRMLHNVSRDTLLLADLPNEKEFAFEVSADYTPTHEDDKGGIIVWKNGEENIEFLETEDGTRETTELKWMACKDNEDWTFFSDYGEGFNFCDSDRMNCSKFGVVLKKGSNSKFINLDIDSIIATRGRKLTIANIAPNISVEMEDEFGRIIFNGNTGYNTGIQITLPSLEFAGKVILKNVEGKELGVIKTTFYGGDVYGFGSNLEIKFSGEELSTLAQTRLPDMISGKSEIMLELVNPSVARANNVNLSIAQYEDKFGWSWADIALDSNGKPGQYQDSINIPYVNPEKTIKFWLKVTKGTDYVGLAPLQFQIHLEHE